MTTMALSKSHSFGSLNIHQNLAHFSGNSASSPSSNFMGQQQLQQRPSTPINTCGENFKTNSSLRIQRIPFHKRHLNDDDCTDWATSSANSTSITNINSSTNSKKISFSQSNTSSKSTNPAACYSATFYQSSCSSDNIPKQRFVLSHFTSTLLVFWSINQIKNRKKNKSTKISNQSIKYVNFHQIL